ncbi:extracellular solute-binding protein [Paenibacillus abyssi]|uniref:Sugar ABC transporter permease n=1 Tax=Paenibacillus abyssi TaxID=1340531 RepID=A0A917G7M6_9BACL|nr:extracellular solute-binding protein [Paenibacillus abyssi]GGG26393.1 sugar ABC transporter permease [Paenibacillus abyssi]
MKAKRSSKLFLIISLMFVMVITACSNNNGGNNAPAAPATNAPSNNTPANNNGTNAAAPEELTLPITEETTQLDMWLLGDPMFRGASYNEKPSFATMQERTNIEINWVMGSGANGPEAFNLLMASGQIPDMVLYTAMITEGPKYGQQGAFAPLTDYINQYAPNFKRILDENPDVRRLITSADGEIYHFPNLNLDEYLMVQMFPQIRQDWLEKLSLEEPKTTEDWYNVLKAFKEQDPNGNGQSDEIPFVSVNLQTMFKIFGPAFGTDWEFYLDNGQVKFGPIEPEYKEAIGYLNKLYSEQLIDPNYLVDTEFKFLTEKVTNDRAGAWIGWAGSYMRSFTDLMADHPSFEIVGTEPPAGPNGDQRFAFHAWPVTNLGIAISAQSDNIVEAVKWLDFQYSEEGIMLNNFGVEGVSYEVVDGYPTFNDAVFNNPDGLSATESLLAYTIGGGQWATVQDPRYAEQYDIEAAIEAKNKVSPFVDYDVSLPPFTFSTEQNDIITPILADIRTYRDEFANAMVMGNRPVDDFDSFVEQIKGMGIDRVLEVYQEAYDNYMSVE